LLYGRARFTCASETMASKECALFPGFYGYAIQLVLFVISLGVLVFKKMREDSLGQARTWPTFLLDSSKQLTGAGYIHCLNLIFAMALGEMFEGNGCHWYWANIMIDTTLGVLFLQMFLFLFTQLAMLVTGDNESFKTGSYRSEDSQAREQFGGIDSPSAQEDRSPSNNALVAWLEQDGEILWDRYFKQLFIWLCCCTCMKISMGIVMAFFHVEFLWAAAHVLKLFEWDAKLELFIVMIVTPMIMNALQFWLVDNFIKKKIVEKVAKLRAARKPQE